MALTVNKTHTHTEKILINEEPCELYQKKKSNLYVSGISKGDKRHYGRDNMWNDNGWEFSKVMLYQPSNSEDSKP